VLRPGGWAVLQVPYASNLPITYEDSSKTSAEEQELAFGQRDHVRIYGRDYTKRLQDAGFRVEPFVWTQAWNKLGKQSDRTGLNEEEVLFIAHKDPTR